MPILGTLLVLSGCQKENKSSVNNPESTDVTAAKIGPANTAGCVSYSVSLSRTFADGKTTFIWTIVNPNPGNGTGSTIQDLSHWSFVPGCSGDNGLEQNWSDIIKAEYSADGGNTWIQILPTPELKPDPSQTCSNANVFKYDIGTTGSNPTKYKLVVAGNYAQGENFAVFKSGARTGCCTRTVPGIGCKVEHSCSYSQGYYFGSPNPWLAPATVTVSGYTYTEAEGRAIWNCSNAGGIKDSKKGFLQVAAVRLSNAYPTGNALIDADVALIEAWLATKGKLVACSNLPDQTSAEIATYGDVSIAAGRIGQWITANHCTIVEDPSRQ